MLSDLERNRLKTRETDIPKTRAINDMRVKKKLRAWLDDGFDALEIFHAIPEDKLKEDLTDADVYRLLTLVRYILVARRFMAIQGELEKPAEWEAVGYDITRAADSTDVGRSTFVDYHVLLSLTNSIPSRYQAFQHTAALLKALLKIAH